MKINIDKYFLLIIALMLVFASCEKEEAFERTRLFRPVLNEELYAELNTIIVNMGNIREANSYTLEISRDTFTSLDYNLEVDTSYIVINEELLNGDQLLWNTLYQVRVTAHADDPTYDSRVSELGNVRTQRFPSILNIPQSNDVIDVAAKVSWQLAGAAVTKIKSFTPSDLKLSSPLKEYGVDETGQQSGEFIVTDLEPSTTYQLAIYSSGPSGDVLRGWETYTTLEAGVDLTAPNVIDLTESEDPDTVIAVVATAADGDIIVLKKGVLYNLPSASLDKSITIRGGYGFGAEKAVLFTTGNWNIAEGAMINHIRFIDLELRGEDIGGDYVFNPNRGSFTQINELTFDNCIINHFRGIMRIRGEVFITNYTINNSIVHHIGGYGTLTTDTGGDGKAAVDNVVFQNSTFSKINTFFQTRQNVQSFTIDGCTINEVAATGARVFRFRGGDGKNNVMNGLSIINSIWGHGWDEGESGNYNVRFLAEGLGNTSFTVVNTYGTSGFSADGYEMPGFPALKYNGSASDLWVDAYDKLDFNFKDTGFSGKYDAGDPRWRAKL